MAPLSLMILVWDGVNGGVKSEVSLDDWQLKLSTKAAGRCAGGRGSLAVWD